MWLFDKRKLHNIEYWLLIIVGVICLFGLFAILLATADAAGSSEESGIFEILSRLNLNKVLRQAIWIVFSVAVMACVAMLDYHVYSKIWIAVLVICVGLIVYTSFFGVVRGGTRGWIKITETVTFQPTEVGKLGLILLLAMAITKGGDMKHLTDFRWAAGVMAVFVGALLTQMDIGTSLVYVVIFAVMLFAGGMQWKHIGILAAISVAGCVALWFLMGDKQQARIITFLSGEESDQLKYAKIAIGSGGFFGNGILGENAVTQSGLIPEVETDFIFAAIGESMGFLGGFFLIALYGLMECRMYYVMRHYATDKYGKLIIVGIMAMFFFHIFENIGMVTGIMPITGIPLPFVSYGGTNMLTNLIAIGLVESVCLNRPIQPFTDNA